MIAPRLVFAALAALAGPAMAQPGQVLEARIDGRTEPFDLTVGRADLGEQGPVWWRQSVARIGAAYLRLHMRLDGEAPDGLEVTVDGLSGLRFTYGADDFRDDGLWTGLMPNGRAVVSLSAPERPDDVVLTIDEITYQAPTGLLFSTHGENQITHINDPSVSDDIRAMAPPVAKLVFQSGGKPRSCTGFLVDEATLMTNEHCINSEEACDSLAVVFGYEVGADGRLAFGEQFSCAHFDPDRTNFELDASLVELTGSPAETYGIAELAENDADVELPLVIVQHPGGDPKQVSVVDCGTMVAAVDGRGPGTDFTHTCDTAGGSSGSPVFDADGKVVGLHHYGFNDGNVAEWTENRAVRLLKLRAWLADLH